MSFLEIFKLNSVDLLVCDEIYVNIVGLVFVCKFSFNSWHLRSVLIKLKWFFSVSWILTYSHDLDLVFFSQDSITELR